MNSVKGTNALKKVVLIPAHKDEEVKIRVAAYTRVSTNSEDQLNSFENQMAYYTRHIEKEEKYELVDLYADEGITGTSAIKRKEFLRMMDDARQGLIDRILTKSISRFARNVIEALNYARELKSLGVSVDFDKENIDTETLTSENILTLYTVLAERESQNISENCKRSNRKRMAKGEYVSSNAPFGYRLVNKKLEIYKPEALVVKRIFTEYLSGKGWMTIAKGLIENEVAKKDGTTKWEKQAIMSILTNERYIGDMLMQKTFNEDTVPYKKVKNDGQLAKYYISDTHDKIIEREQFEIVQEMLSKKRAINTVQNEYTYSKKIKCSTCGTSYRRKVINGKVYWNCRNKELRPDLCNSLVITEETIDKAFINMYNKIRMHRETIFAEMIKQIENVDDILYKDSIEIKQINKELAELSEQNLTMTGLLSQGILDSAIFMPKRDEMQAKIQKLKSRKSIILKNRSSNELLIQTQEILEALNKGSEYITETNKSLFDEIVKEIIGYNEEVIVFKLHNGLEFKERITK